MTGEIVYLRPAPELSMISCACDGRLFLMYVGEEYGQYIECVSCGAQHDLPIVFGDEDAATD